MKKLMLSLAVACVSAATAFAETWFGNVVTKDAITSGSWSTTISTLMGDNSYITYKDMEHDLVFTANTAQTLPGDEATVNTTVKFTAMAMEDFVDLTNANKTAWADAKGGLTIIEEPENTYKFYGLVNGEWVALGTAENAKAVIDGNAAVDVEVKIWENNGRKISYKVAKDTTTYLESTGNAIAATVTGSTINQIAYRGNCEISSLTGDRADELWEITLTGLLDAVATLKVGATSRELTTEEKTAGKASIKATKTDNISIAYAPAPDYMFFAKTGTDKSGKSSAESTQVTVDGDEAINVVPANYDYAKVVAKVDAGEETEASYQSLANAIAAGANKTVTVVSAPEETAQTIHATMNLNATDFTVAGNIKINAGAALTILGGNFSGTLTGALLISGPSTFAQVDKDTASGLCATGWFARQGQTAGSSYVEAGKAEPYVDPSGVQIVYDEEEVSPEQLAATGANGKPGWVNYALGIDNTVTTVPSVKKASADATTLVIAPSTKGRPGTGFVIAMTKDGVAFDGDLPLEAGNYVIKTILTNGTGKVEEVATKTIGVQKPEVSEKEAADLKLVSVPYDDLTSGGNITIDQLINKANLEPGDSISIPDTAVNSTGYRTWTLDDNGEWIGGGVAASAYTVKAGQGLWLKTKAKSFFQFGEVRTGTTMTLELTDTWNLLSGTIDLNTIEGASKGDTIRVENVEGVIPTDYTFDGEKWVTYTTGSVEKMVRGRKIYVVTTEEVPVTSPIDSGADGMWYIKNGTGKTIVKLVNN